MSRAQIHPSLSAVWKIQAGKRKDFEPVLQNLMEPALKVRGHLGGTVLRPKGEPVSLYRSTIAFDSRTHFEVSDSSADCKAQVKEAEAFAEEPEEIQFLNGLDIWFASSGATSSPPAAWKTIILTTSSLYPWSGSSW